VLGGFATAALCAACSSDPEPSTGNYTIQFPSTAAAVATDTVQLLFFDLPDPPADRGPFCQSLIQARKRKDPQKPSTENVPVNICEMLGGLKPITVAYGEVAILAVAQRRGEDFMIGCAIQTIGNGDAPVPIAMSLIDVGNTVPDTSCASVSDFCSLKCPAQ
jgi:hypothetical protein